MDNDRILRWLDRAAPLCFALAVLLTGYCALALYLEVAWSYVEVPFSGMTALVSAALSLLAVPLLFLAQGKARRLLWAAVPLGVLWTLLVLVLPGLVAGAGAGAAFPG